MTKLLTAITGIFVLTLGLSVAEIQPKPTNQGPRPLLIASSSAPIAGGKVTLNIDELSFKDGSYVGSYHIKVSPYFFKNEKGKITIAAPEESLRKFTNGLAVDFSGKAVSSKGRVKQITGKVTPTGKDAGNVSLWFDSNGTKFTFETTYRSVDN